MSGALVAWTDEELVSRSARGDHDSFNELVVRWQRPIFALAYRVIGHEEDARDVCQETFLRAFRGIKGFKGQAKFSSWLYRITINLCYDKNRRAQRSPLSKVSDNIDVLDLAPAEVAGNSLEDQVGWRELGSEVSRAMMVISPEQRTAIVLKEYQGLTFREIADLQGCPVSTVKTRVYQGLTRLRQELESRGIDRVATFPSRAPDTGTRQRMGEVT
jgi:RNA polymerase sigma-70 factor (ECF subfamily)